LFCERTAGNGSVAIRAEPDLYDVAGWRALVDELSAASGDDARPTYLGYAVAHLAAIENATQAEPSSPAETPAERQTGTGWELLRRKPD